jgi:hypothetical protein
LFFLKKILVLSSAAQVFTRSEISAASATPIAKHAISVLCFVQLAIPTCIYSITDVLALVTQDTSAMTLKRYVSSASLLAKAARTQSILALLASLVTIYTKERAGKVAPKTIS